MGKVSSLLLAAFPAEKQKGPKTSKKTGEVPGKRAQTQHGELAGAEDAPETKTSNRKPKMATDHSKAKIFHGSYDAPISKGGKPNAESPMERVQRRAHEAKARATERWIDGGIGSKEHDDIHRRANAVLKSSKRNGYG